MQDFKTYKEFYNYSIENPEAFWKEQASKLNWHSFPKQILSKDAKGYPQWFADGQLNMSALCLDQHVSDGYGSQTAIIYDSPVTDTLRKITYGKLQEQVSKFAGSLRKLGLSKGDTAIIYMPMIPETVVAMLACARIGVIHSVVFGGFAPHELAIRIDDCSPKAIITASCGIEIQKIVPYKPFVDRAVEEAKSKPEHIIVYQREHGPKAQMKATDLDFMALLEGGVATDPVPLESTHPLYILYTSGTTGTPKGIQRDTGGYATAMKFSMGAVYGVEPGDVYWAASDVGWVVGHSYIVYGPLINRNTTVLFEGKPVKTPDAGTFWRVISQHKVKVMFTAPTAIRAIKKEDPDGRFIKSLDMSSLKYQFLAGERCDAATLNWLQEKLGVPVIDHWWQTESGWAMLANMAGIELLPVKPGSASFPVCGYDIRILGPDGTELGPNEEGLVSVKLPMPPGTLTDLWNNSTRFQKSYFDQFAGYYSTGDGGYKDEDGYYFITGRVDDIINVAGHRLSTAEMEEVVAAHPAVAECAVIGVADDLKGQIPMAIIVMKTASALSTAEIQAEIVRDIRNTIGPVASLKKVVPVKRLPKTRSGKTLRKLLRAIAEKAELKIPSTIDDVDIIGEVQEVFGTAGVH
ncbi:MAG: propionyl-CoA synthetase [Bacteroidetes bacterium]|nr:propionyl-CoA synthetase [Bacteroidota bacterium]